MGPSPLSPRSSRPISTRARNNSRDLGTGQAVPTRGGQRRTNLESYVGTSIAVGVVGRPMGNVIRESIFALIAMLKITFA